MFPITFSMYDVLITIRRQRTTQQPVRSRPLQPTVCANADCNRIRATTTSVRLLKCLNSTVPEKEKKRKKKKKKHGPSPPFSPLRAVRERLKGGRGFDHTCRIRQRTKQLSFHCPKDPRAKAEADMGEEDGPDNKTSARTGKNDKHAGKQEIQLHPVATENQAGRSQPQRRD
jgi:hypothetical protein